MGHQVPRSPLLLGIMRRKDIGWKSPFIHPYRNGNSSMANSGSDIAALGGCLTAAQRCCGCRYQETSDNPLGYWGLDYPPLSAYQARLHLLCLHATKPTCRKSFGPASVIRFTEVALGYWTQCTQSSFVIQMVPEHQTALHLLNDPSRLNTAIWTCDIVAPNMPSSCPRHPTVFDSPARTSELASDDYIL